eukprot:5679816-Pyramimonas_sp.AAC.1
MGCVAQERRKGLHTPGSCAGMSVNLLRPGHPRAPPFPVFGRARQQMRKRLENCEAHGIVAWLPGDAPQKGQLFTKE